MAKGSDSKLSVRGPGVSLRYFRVISAPTLGLALILANLGAQQSKVLAPHKPVAPLYTGPNGATRPAVLQVATGALWMTDANFKSALYLQNQLKNVPITVTPILYLNNGARYTLP